MIKIKKVRFKFNQLRTYVHNCPCIIAYSRYMKFIIIIIRITVSLNIIKKGNDTWSLAIIFKVIKIIFKISCHGYISQILVKRFLYRYYMLS